MTGGGNLTGGGGEEAGGGKSGGKAPGGKPPDTDCCTKLCMDGAACLLAFHWPPTDVWYTKKTSARLHFSSNYFKALADASKQAVFLKKYFLVDT